MLNRRGWLLSPAYTPIMHHFRGGGGLSGKGRTPHKESSYVGFKTITRFREVRVATSKNVCNCGVCNCGQGY